MANIIFDDNSKENLLNDICNSYFNKNFGKLSKSDYELSKQLGITQSRVRTLKQLKYKKYDNFNDGWWKDEINNSLVNVHFDKNNNTIRFIVDDINVKEEVIHYIESRGWYDDTTLNKKLISIPLQCYLDIFIDDDTFMTKFGEEERKKLEEICNNNNIADDDKKTILEFAKDFSKDALSDILKTGTKEVF